MAKKNKIQMMRGERGFHYTALVIMTLMMIFCVVPLILMFTVSLSSETSLVYGYRFIPEEWSFDAYVFMWAKRATIFRAYGLTILVTVVGTAASLVMTSLFAYPLSRKDFKLRNVFAFILFFTMLFNGGMVASYMVWTRIFHVKDTLWAYLLPGSLMGGMNVLLVRNYFNANIPYSIIEAARLDGAKDWTIYSKIMVPLSKPIMKTIGLFSALGYWNNWTAGIYYINNPKLYTIQVYLKKLMDSIQFLKTTDLSNEAVLLAQRNLPTESARMAVAIIALIPILAVYPFVQKKLIKGMVIGGVKG